MTISPSGKLYRWTYLLTDPYRRPDRISLCRFFWRAFVWMPLFWAAVAAVIIGFLVASWNTKGLIPATFLGFFGVMWGLGKLGARYGDDFVFDLVYKVRKSTFAQGLKAVKGKFCPIIEFEDDI